MVCLAWLARLRYVFCTYFCSVHFYITPVHIRPGILEKFVADLKHVVKGLLEDNNRVMDGLVNQCKNP